MVKIIAVAAAKGGCGRTTLSVHLSVNATMRKIVTRIIDLDPSTSAAQWGDFRKAASPQVVSVPAQRLGKAIDSARTDNIDLIVIDGAPNAPEVMLEACEIADLIVVPTRPGIVDIRVNRRSAKIARVSGKDAWALITQARVGSPRLVEDAQNALAEAGFKIVPHILHQRSAFSHCMVTGETAQEYEPDGRAAKEIDAVTGWSLEMLSLGARRPARRSDRVSA